MGRHRVSLVGKRYGRLTVISSTGVRHANRHYYYMCRCDCGMILDVLDSNLKSGNSTSCGVGCMGKIDPAIPAL